MPEPDELTKQRVRANVQKMQAQQASADEINAYLKYESDLLERELAKPKPVEEVQAAEQSRPSANTIAAGATHPFLSALTAGAAKATGSIGNVLGKAADKLDTILPFSKPEGNPSMFTQAGESLNAFGNEVNEAVPEGGTKAIGNFTGALIPGAAVGAMTAGVVNPLLAGGQQALLGGVASKASQMVASKAAQKAIQVGITTLPQELIGGVIAESIINPEAFEDGKSILSVLALSTLGSGINAGLAFKGAIKEAKTVADLEKLKGLVQEAYTPKPLTVDTYNPRGPVELPKPVQQANPFSQQASELQVDPLAIKTGNPSENLSYSPDNAPISTMGSEIGRTFGGQDPNTLPSWREASQRRVQEILDRDIEARISVLDNNPKGGIPQLEKGNPLDEIQLAVIAGTEERLKELKKLYTPLGKGKQTNPELLIDPNDVSPKIHQLEMELSDITQKYRTNEVSLEKYQRTRQEIEDKLAATKTKAAPPDLVPPTLDELREHLGAISRTNSIEDTKKLFHGFKEEGVGMGVLPSMREKALKIQDRLDHAAAQGRKNLSPQETQEIVDDMLKFINEHERGITFPKKSTHAPSTEKPAKEALKNITGSDLSTAAKLEEGNVAAVVDDSYKRWVTGSDDTPIPTTPVAKAAYQASAEEYADLVRGAKIDYNSDTPHWTQQLWYKLKNAKTEFYDRAWGAGQYSEEARNRINMLSGVSAKAETFIKQRVTRLVADEDGVWRGKSEPIEAMPLEKIINSAGDDGVTELDALLKAKVKVANPDYELGVSLEWAEGIVNKAPQRMHDLATEFKKNMDVMVDDAVLLGQLAANTGERMKLNFYATMGRVHNNPTSSNPFRKRVGSLKDTKSPLISSQDAIFKWYEAIHKNHAYNALVEEFHSNPQKFEGVMSEANKTGAKEFERKVAELVQSGESEIDATQIALMELPPFDRTDGTLRIFKSGQIKYYKINKDIARTVESLNPVEFGIFKSVLSAVSRPIRVGVPLALDLSLIGPMSDMVLTTARVPNFIPIISNIEGLFHAAVKSDKYIERINALGAFGGRFEPGGRTVGKTPGAKAIITATDWLMKPFEALKEFTKPLSDAARMGEYLVRTRNGETPQAAALAARRTMGDFNRHGASLRSWGLITEFGNVGITTSGAAWQMGRDAYVAATKGDMNPLIRVVSTGVGSIMLPTIYFWQAAQDDPKVLSYMRSDDGYKNWYFRSPFAKKEEDGSWGVSKVPILGWWMGSVFGSATLAYLDGLGKEEATRFAEAFTSQVGFNLTPIPAQTTIGLMTNVRNPLSPLEENIPITPRSQQGLLPMAMGGPGTSPLGELAARNGINPYKVDYLADRVTGNLFNPIIKAMGGGKKGGAERSDIPIYGRFFIKEGSPTEGQEAFYRDIEAANKVEASYQVFLKSGNSVGIEKLFADERNQDLLVRRKDLEDMASKVSDLRKLIQQVTGDESISKEGRREYLTALYDAMDQYFQAYAEVKMPK